MEKCEQKQGCVDVSYSGGACYLKGTLGELINVSHVWTGQRIVEEPSASSTSTEAPVLATSTLGGSVSASQSATSTINSDVSTSTTESDASSSTIASDVPSSTADSDSTSSTYSSDVASSTVSEGSSATIADASSTVSDVSSSIVSPEESSTATSSDDASTTSIDSADVSSTASDAPISTVSSDESSSTVSIEGSSTTDAPSSAASDEESSTVTDSASSTVSDDASTTGPSEASSSTVAEESITATSDTATSGTSTSTSATPTFTRPPQEPLSCDNNASNGKVYMSETGMTYDIICGKEYDGGDVGAEDAATFEECIALCDENHRCNDVSFVHGRCYMKQATNGPLSTAGHVWTARQNRLTCIEGVAYKKIFVTPAGREYEIYCGTDFAGGDIGEVKVPTMEACLEACDAASDRGCVTVAYNNDLCYFKDRLRERIARPHVWGALYLGMAPTGQPSSSSVVVSSTTSTSSEAESTTTEEPSTSVPNSPPLASSKVYPPEFDDSWTSTYSYMEISMPVHTGTPTQDAVSRPTDTGCFIGPEEFASSFHLLDFKSGYVIKKGDDGQDKPAGPGFLTAPETEKEGREQMAMLADWKPPVYKLERPDGAPQSLYDLVYVDGTQKLYFSVSADGAITFAEASSESTTVFTVDCNANLVITLNRVKHDFLANEFGRTYAAPQGPDGPSENTIRYLRPSDVPENPNSLAVATRMIKKRSYDGMGQSGWAPRCEGTARNVWPRVKSGARDPDPNGCGSRKDKVPDLNFRGCCNEHDNCFDDCGKTFERCNLEFGACMVRACVNDYSRWYNFWLQPGCIATAGFYTTVVSTWPGRDAFYDSNEARCECYCHNQPDHALCGKQCINVRSNPANCGGCGRTCPPGTHCSGMGCVCSKNTCDGLCLDFLTHPRNCGRCGNLCDSGYCYKGQCYDPPENPDTCLPREAFENGDFQRGDGSAWTVIPGTLSANNFALGVGDGAASPDRYGMMVDFPLGRDHEFQMRQQVHMCPGQAYELTFKARRVYGDGNCVLQVRVGDKVLANQALATTVTNWTRFGPYRLDNIALGQVTVRQGTRHYLTKEFNVQVVCTGQRGVASTIRMDNFSIAPV
ncbi:hypothetical protein QBC35DRAFT_497327 [Podospora australis]|uniref:Apple domain-containing protein n=1 Tax=Podospora australis TaxID=1536484 RepID=A0AAN6WV36_9PEZI|nr:hypothetical protein QBC35DRAFT_497327 [Podospora australis]